MKTLFRKIDQAGLFVEDVFHDDTGPIPGNLIATPCPGGFYRPKWNGSQWVEGGSAPAPTADQVRGAEVDAAIKADTVIQALQAMSNAQYDAWWTNRSAAQKDLILKSVLRLVVRRLA